MSAHRRKNLAAGVVAAVLLLVVAVLPGIAAAAGRQTLLARFKWSVSGSMKHAWTVTSSDPCAAIGGGTVAATFAGTPPHVMKIVRNRYGTFYDYDPQTNLHGSITMLDDTTQNPPQPGDTCPPIDKGGCGTRSLKQGFGYLEPSIEPPGNRIEFTGADFGNAFSAGDCEHGGFNDMGRSNGRFLPHLYPGLPSAKVMAHRKSFTLTKSRTDANGDGDHGHDVQTRTVTVRFTRLR